MSNTKHISATATFKVKADGDAVYTHGKVTALVSVFNNVDLVGDRIMPGAFKKSLQAIETAGKSIPFVWSHQWDNPDAYIGKIIDAKETKNGLEVTAALFDTATAQHIKTLLSEGVVTEFSFAYDVIKQKEASDGVNELLEVNILEAGPTLKGANPATVLINVRSAMRIQTKAVNLEAPTYMQEFAARGIKYYEEGLAGDGVVPQTIEDARKMASGEVSEAKWRKIGPWVARHLVDLESEGAVDGEITPGVVAHLLWGSGTSKADANRTLEYAKGVVSRIDDEADTSARHDDEEEEDETYKAEAGELEIGNFVTWDAGFGYGRVEYIMTEGFFGVDSDPLSLEATPEDPLAMVRVYDEFKAMYHGTDVFKGFRFSELTLSDERESEPTEVDTASVEKSSVSRTRIKVGRTISSKNEERLQTAKDLLVEVLSTLDAKTQEPTQAKVAEHDDTALLYLLQIELLNRL